MSLNKKILIIFGVLFLGTLLFVPYVNASVPQECIIIHETCVGSVCIPFPSWGCKKIAPGETETGLCYGSACYDIRNLGASTGPNYFVPLNSPSEFYNFLTFARNNPTILYIEPKHCVKWIAYERDTDVSISTNQPIYYGRGFFESTSSSGIYKILPGQIHYTFKLVNAGTFDCTNSFFGGDPYSGKVKDCYIAVTCPGAAAPTSPSGGGSSGDSGGVETIPICIPSLPPSSSDYGCGNEYIVGDGCGGSHSGVGSSCPDGGYTCTVSGCKAWTLNR